jgi:two-component sensor histidine kinase
MDFRITLLFCWLGLTGFSQSFNGEEQHEIDSLFAITNSTKHDSLKATAYIQLSNILYTSNLDTLLVLCQKAVEIAENNLTKTDVSTHHTFLRLKSEGYANIGYYYQTKSEYNQALFFYLKCLKLDLEPKNLKGLSSTFNNIGMLYTYKGDTKKSLKYYLISLKIDEFLNDDESIGSSLNNIAYTYEHQGDTTNALLYYKKAQHFFQLQNNTNNEAGVLINIGSIYRKQGKTTESLSYFKQSLENYSKLSNELGKASALLNIGVAYFDLHQLDSSLIYIEQSLAIYKKSNRKSGITIALVNLGKIHVEKLEWLKAIEVGEIARSLAIETGNLYNIQNAAQLLSRAYEQTKNYKSALEMHQLFINSRDSIENKETQRATIQQQMQYDFDKKEILFKAENDKKIAIAQAEKQKQKSVTIAVSIGLFLALIFGLFALNRWRVAQQQKQVIEQKNEENKMLLGEIHHRVKNNLQVISSLLSLQERTTIDPSTKAAIQEGKERVKSMGLIHKMLYQNDNYSGIEMNDYVNQLLHGLLDTFGKNENEIKLVNTIKNIKLDVDTAIPIGLILNELAINSLKYAFNNIQNPEIKISLQQVNNNLCLSFSDNGNGKISDLNTQNDSFGMKLINSLTRQLNGTILIDDTIGLTITINFTRYKLI